MIGNFAILRRLTLSLIIVLFYSSVSFSYAFRNHRVERCGAIADS